MTQSNKPETRSYFAATSGFAGGPDTPSAFLERCLESFDEWEPKIGAFVATNPERAREDAKAADERWKSGKTLSLIDGMPIGIKDIMETADMVTEQGSPLFKGWQGGRDSAAVAALREAGAVILGKTVTTEFAASHPRGTRNPWDTDRTPGGSSSGSAASVASGIMAAALGTQVVGSILRPASFCGVYGFKPSVGGINRGGSFDGFSQSCSGVLAATLAEVWSVARAISARAGGDAGYVGLTGPLELPEPVKPKRIALLETGAWDGAKEEAKNALQGVADSLAGAGIGIITRASNKSVERAEEAISTANQLSLDINAWEGRWPLNTYARDMDRSSLSPSAQDRLSQAEGMSQEEYAALLAERDGVRQTYEALAAECDLTMSLSANGAAPIGLNTTGDPKFVSHGSLLGTPAISIPLLEAEGLPLGLQLMGYTDKDAALFAGAAALLGLLQA